MLEFGIENWKIALMLIMSIYTFAMWSRDQVPNIVEEKQINEEPLQEMSPQENMTCQQAIQKCAKQLKEINQNQQKRILAGTSEPIFPSTPIKKINNTYNLPTSERIIQENKTILQPIILTNSSKKSQNKKFRFKMFKKQKSTKGSKHPISQNGKKKRVVKIHYKPSSSINC